MEKDWDLSIAWSDFIFSMVGLTFISLVFVVGFNVIAYLVSKVCGNRE